MLIVDRDGRLSSHYAAYHVWVNLTIGPIVGLPAFGVGMAVDTNEGVRVVVGSALRRVGAGNEISVGVKVSVGTGEGIFEGIGVRSEGLAVVAGEKINVGIVVDDALGIGEGTGEGIFEGIEVRSGGLVGKALGLGIST
jgi:hypothetical protein